MRGELLEAKRVYAIVGAFYTVYNYYGYGLSESVYVGALDPTFWPQAKILSLY